MRSKAEWAIDSEARRVRGIIVLVISNYFTIKNCDKTFLEIILRLKKLLKSDDVSTLAERHYQVKIS